MVDPVPEIERPQGPQRIREALLILGGTLALAVMALWWATRPLPRERPRFSSTAGSDRETLGAYAGPRACGECHPGESALHSRSGHGRTLRLAAKLPIARRLAGRTVDDPETPGVSWSYDRRDGELVVERRQAGSIEPFVIDYAFGSGHHATTFLTLIDQSTPIALEHRLTHYTADDSLRITPGQRAAAPSPGTTPHGRKPSPDDTLKCFRCHSTRMSVAGEGLDVKELIPNVSCERCHGPARGHVENALAGRADLVMPFGTENWTAESQLKLCGECHRHPSRAAPGMIRPDNPALARFQPVGISQSLCYTKSPGTFSCVTCHDPHARASSDRTGYEKACLQCHETSPAAVCKVSPRGGCIDCHMPRVDSGQKVLFTDHWIRVRREAGAVQGP
jgi:Cytochrome c554 and c-prime